MIYLVVTDVQCWCTLRHLFDAPFWSQPAVDCFCLVGLWTVLTFCCCFSFLGKFIRHHGKHWWLLGFKCWISLQNNVYVMMLIFVYCNAWVIFSEFCKSFNLILINCTSRVHRCSLIHTRTNLVHRNGKDQSCRGDGSEVENTLDSCDSLNNDRYK